MTSRKYDNVIVFGPTGTIGGLVALEASKRGAKVWLAMRDPSKKITEIPSDVEKAGMFTRIQADLSDPTSIANAVKESAAKAAYVYLVFVPDFLRESFQAMRDAGIEYVVFLSSFTIRPGDDVRQIPKDKLIPFFHAQAEIAIEEVGFPYFAMLRPGRFATNHIKYSLDTTVQPPRARLMYDDTYEDNIAPEDIGAVGGAVLAERPSDRKEIIYLLGPEVLTAGEAWATIKRVTGRDDIDTTLSTPEEWTENRIKGGMNPGFAKYQADLSVAARVRELAAPEALHREGVANIGKYAGREPTKFAQYLEWHKADWANV